MPDDNVKLIQLKIMYLFMFSDGICSQSEVNQFLQICERLDVSEKEKKIIIDFIKPFKFNNNSDNSHLIIEIIGTMLGIINPNSPEVKNNIQPDSSASIIQHDKAVQMNTIWLLINLEYADMEHAKAEKEIIEYLKFIWDIDQNFIDTASDTVSTIFALIQKKKWINSTTKSLQEKQIINSEINNDIKKLYLDIKNTILESLLYEEEFTCQYNYYSQD